MNLHDRMQAGRKREISTRFAVNFRNTRAGSFVRTGMMQISPVLTALAGALLLTGCDATIGYADTDAFQKDFRYGYALKSGATFTLENKNGSVDIAGWDREEVEITGVQYGKTEALRDAVKIEITRSDSSVAIRTIHPSEPNQGAGARYVIRVPRKVTLERVVSTNGKVHISDIDGAVRMHTSNGSVQIAKILGNVDAQSSNGSLQVNQVGGSAHLHTTNGSIHSEAVKGSVDATSSNGSITLTMSAGLTGEVRASTSNASITARVPAATAARLRASTSNGDISSAFETGNPGKEERRRIDTAINGGSGGSPLIDLTTSNGKIRIEKL